MSERGTMLRVSDADREAVVAALRDGFLAGRLELDEFTDRVDRAYSATTTGELESVRDGLPDEQTAEKPRRRVPRLFPGNTRFAVRYYSADSPRRAVEDAIGTILPPLLGSGYDLDSDEPSTRIFVRDERPTWTIIAAVLLFPVGLVALAFRDRSRVVVNATAQRRGRTAVNIYGTAPVAVRRAIRDLAAATVET